MANAFSSKSTLVSGRSLVLDAAPPSAMTLVTLVLSGDIAIEWEVYIDRDISTLSVGAVSASDNNNAGSILTDTTVYVRVTAVDVDGKESPPSASISKKTGSGNIHTIVASWIAVAGAVSYNVYASTKSGQETFYINVTTATANISAMPVNLSLSLPSAPDIHIISPIGAQSIPVMGVPLSARLVVYAKVSSGGSATISCLAQ